MGACSFACTRDCHFSPFFSSFFFFFYHKRHAHLMHSKAARIHAGINTVRLVFQARGSVLSACRSLTGLRKESCGKKKVCTMRNEKRTSAVSLLRPRMTDKLNLRPINIINIWTERKGPEKRAACPARPAHAYVWSTRELRRAYIALWGHTRGALRSLSAAARDRVGWIIRGTASRGPRGGHFWLLIHPMVDSDGPMGPIVGYGGTRDLALAREYDYEYLDAIMIRSSTGCFFYIKYDKLALSNCNTWLFYEWVVRILNYLSLSP